MKCALAVLVVSAGCGKEAPAPAITCGSGTVLEGTECVVAAAAVSPSMDAVPIAVPPDASPATWQYRISRDQLRNEDTRIAQIESANTVRIGGRETHIMMGLAQGPGDTVPTIVFEPEHGQLACDFIMCIHARFDEQKVKAWPGAFVSGAIAVAGTDKAKSDWLKQLRTSSNVIVELAFAGSGHGQFTFQVTGLVWDVAETIPSQRR